MSTSFAHFGCWNLFACKPEYVTSQVVKSIREDPEIGFVTVAGDNIYSQIKTKPVNYSVAKLRDGLGCLKMMEKPMVIVLGNHDVADSSKDCEITKEQHRPTSAGGWGIDPAPIWVKEIPQVPNSLFIGVDTNFLVAYTKMACYGKTANRDSIYREMLETLSREDFSPHLGKNIFILGHVPIVSIVSDDELSDVFVSSLDVVFKDILDILTEKGVTHVYYLCADTHSYQDMALEYTSEKTGASRSGASGSKASIVVRQIVAGTGGAKMQDLPNTYITTDRELIPAKMARLEKIGRAHV